MCTLILMRQMFAEFPLIVASNRDEDPTRPSADPLNWGDQPAIFAPRDLVRGGTWIGTARHGLFVGMTNRDTVPHRAQRASRGRLVADTLVQPSARAARDHILRAFAVAAYNGFHLVAADRHEAFLLIGDDDRLTCEQLSPGATMLTAYGHGPAHVPRVVEIERRLLRLQQRNDASPEALDSLLAFHANGEPRAAACVHDPLESHRTMSSMLVRVDHNWSVFEHWFRNGPACSGPFGSSARVAIAH